MTDIAWINGTLASARPRAVGGHSPSSRRRWSLSWASTATAPGTVFAICLVCMVPIAIITIRAQIQPILSLFRALEGTVALALI